MNLKYNETKDDGVIGDFTIYDYDGKTKLPVNTELLFTPVDPYLYLTTLKTKSKTDL